MSLCASGSALNAEDPAVTTEANGAVPLIIRCRRPESASRHVTCPGRAEWGAGVPAGDAGAGRSPVCVLM